MPHELILFLFHEITPVFLGSIGSLQQGYYSTREAQIKERSLARRKTGICAKCRRHGRHTRTLRPASGLALPNDDSHDTMKENGYPS
ncbi:50S ribosomal protein L33 domain protein [Mitsuokella sp. oral taxon 131 str. W9106]|nr:50S ribosomal protein L33 domain protein [Mitsuokella sp. oral taxon 131 str. W9106]